MIDFSVLKKLVIPEGIVAKIEDSTGAVLWEADGDSSGGDGYIEDACCLICGYIYYMDDGLPDEGIAPGTPFSDLPDTWCCSVSGTQKGGLLFEAL